MNGGKWKIAEIGRAEIEEYLYVSFIPQKINYFDTYSVEKKNTWKAQAITLRQIRFKNINTGPFPAFESTVPSGAVTN